MARCPSCPGVHCTYPGMEHDGRPIPDSGPGPLSLVAEAFVVGAPIALAVHEQRGRSAAKVHL